MKFVYEARLELTIDKSGKGNLTLLVDHPNVVIPLPSNTTNLSILLDNTASLLKRKDPNDKPSTVPTTEGGNGAIENGTRSSLRGLDTNHVASQEGLQLQDDQGGSEVTG